MKRHVEKQHSKASAEYDVHCIEDKEPYLERRIARSSTLYTRFDGKNKHMFSINKDIVDVIIGGMLFDPDDDTPTCTREKSLAIFVMIKNAADPVDGAEDVDADQDRSREAYIAETKSARCFDLVVGYVAIGVPF